MRYELARLILGNAVYCLDFVGNCLIEFLSDERHKNQVQDLLEAANFEHVEGVTPLGNLLTRVSADTSGILRNARQCRHRARRISERFHQGISRRFYEALAS